MMEYGIMGAWGHGFFDADSACDMSANFREKLLLHPVARCILFDYYKSLQINTPEGKKVNEIIDQVEQKISLLNTPQNIESVINKYITYSDNAISYLSMCVEGKWAPEQIKVAKPLNLAEAQLFQSIAIKSVFDEADIPHIMTEKLTTKGIQVGEGRYKKASTYDLNDAFYFMGFTVLNMQTKDVEKLLSPYIFQNFLDASSYFLSDSVLHGWTESKKREQFLTEEIGNVFSKTLPNNPKILEVLIAHADKVMKKESSSSNSSGAQREKSVYLNHFLPHIEQQRLGQGIRKKSAQKSVNKPFKL